MCATRMLYIVGPPRPCQCLLHQSPVGTSAMRCTSLLTRHPLEKMCRSDMRDMPCCHRGRTFPLGMTCTTQHQQQLQTLQGTLWRLQSHRNGDPQDMRRTIDLNLPQALVFLARTASTVRRQHTPCHHHWQRTSRPQNMSYTSCHALLSLAMTRRCPQNTCSKLRIMYLQ